MDVTTKRPLLEILNKELIDVHREGILGNPEF
jgi:hypothetical protein